MKDNLIYLPVSLGEAIDKLTILHLKCDFIKDNRLDDVKKEYDLLYDTLKNYILKYHELYNIMKKVNLIIWKQMDTLRDCNTISDEDYFKLCKECIQYNDVRFRIKNKINSISNSSLKEQKSYKITKVLIIINCEVNSDVIQYIKYKSLFFDELYINIQNVQNVQNVENNHNNILKEKFSYDPTIIFDDNNEYNKSENTYIINNCNDCKIDNDIL